MTRKHFIALAKSVVEMQRNGLSGPALDIVVNELVDTCKRSSRSFNEDRFRAACAFEGFAAIRARNAA